MFPVLNYGYTQIHDLQLTSLFLPSTYNRVQEVMHQCPAAPPKPNSRQTSKYYIITTQQDDNVKIEIEIDSMLIYIITV